MRYGLGWLGAAGFAVAMANGCSGEIGDGANKPDPHAQEAVISGAKRLTRVEYDNTLADLLLDTTQSGFAALPEDVTDPFDNDYHTQKVSPALIESAEALARGAAERALASPSVMAEIVPCTPSGAGDEACLRSFISTWGRRALRRPVTSVEADDYVASFLPFAVEADDFDVAVGMVIEAMLQDLEFLYRVELGAPVAGSPGVFRLDQFEVATRLSYFLLGTTPSDELLDIAAAGGLGSPEAVREVAASLLARAEARERVDRFHALWLSYHQLPHGAELTAALRRESQKLVEDIVFDRDTDYLELFRAERTYLDDFLAGHYGYTGHQGEGWYTYPDDRRGILSHGSVLSAGAKFTDTSPTQRGLFVLTRLMCRPPLEPPPNVNVDAPPEPSGATDCKLDAYAAHGGPGCKSCHEQVDGIGFGLEGYSMTGQFRTAEEGKPECLLPGDGYIPDVGDFNGPAGLAELLISTGELESCVVRQVYRFAMGRRDTVDDEAVVEGLAESFTDHQSFKELLLDVAGSRAFGYRRQEEVSP